jgi:hypothetical protein
LKKEVALAPLPPANRINTKNSYTVKRLRGEEKVLGGASGGGRATPLPNLLKHDFFLYSQYPVHGD